MTAHPLHQPVALVTGASSGFGALIAAGLSSKGYRVFGASRQQKPAVLPGSAGIEWLVLDVQSDASVTAGMEQLLGAAGRLDVLVKSAGLAHASVIEETGLEQARQVGSKPTSGAWCALSRPRCRSCAASTAAVSSRWARWPA